MKQNIEYVDLGLPSGLKWAKCNLGANKETEYGDYYMLGSTTPDTRNNCDWAHAPFHNGHKYYDEAYFTAHKSAWFNGDGTLKSQFDAVTVNMGKGWRMPTKVDLQELVDETNREWTTINGINGYKFTNKSDSSKYIFIPASGIRDGSSFDFVGGHGYVRSSSLYSSNLLYAWFLNFSSSNIYVSNYYRYYGYSVRGVYDEKLIDNNNNDKKMDKKKILELDGYVDDLLYIDEVSDIRHTALVMLGESNKESNETISISIDASVKDKSDEYTVFNSLIGKKIRITVETID